MKKVICLGLCALFCVMIFSACRREGLTPGEKVTEHACEGVRWVLIKDAACGEDGEQQLLCSCGAVMMTEALTKLSHSQAVTPAVGATSAKAGLTSGKHCPNCGEVLVPQKSTTMGLDLVFTTYKREEFSLNGMGDATDKELVIPGFYNDCPVTMIKAEAFDGCSTLTSITIPETVTSIGENAFRGCTGLIQTENGVSYVGGWVVACDPCLTNVTLRNGTVGIADKAFVGCNVLESIVLPASMRSIGAFAFSGCSNLSSVTLSSGLERIGNSAFAECRLLRSIELPSSLRSIGTDAFSYCRSLKSIEIPEGITELGENVFYYCYNLQSITIPHSVTQIREWALYNCTNLLTITYAGTRDEWEALDKAAHWNDLTGSYHVHCSDEWIGK